MDIQELFPQKEPIIVYRYELRSRYSETDKMGYAFYGNYPDYFEVARTEMMRSTGFPYARLEEQGIILPVVDMYIKYLKPVYYDHKMLIDVKVFDVPKVRLETFYEVSTEETGALHAFGQVQLAFVDQQKRRPRRAPGYFVEALKSITAVPQS